MSIFNLLTGRSTEHLVPFLEEKYLIHHEMKADLERMVGRAKSDGIELSLTSSFRSYDRQKLLWDNKCLGVTPILDVNSNPIDIQSMESEEILFSILKWSAIPGCSRHHWGSDIDVYDLAAMPIDYKLQLIPSEYSLNGIFQNLSKWLNENMKDYHFFMPYDLDRGGISVEPWHLSYGPLSNNFQKLYDQALFMKHLEHSDFLLKNEVIENAELIFHKYIQLR